MKSRAILSGWALLGAGVLLAGQAGCVRPLAQGRPVWQVARQHQDYPATRYLIGVGSGSSPEQAAERAREDLLAQLRARVSQELEIRAPRVAAQGFQAIRPEAVDELVAEPPGLLPGPSWSSSDGQRHAAMAIIERAEIDTAAREQIVTWEDQCQQLLAGLDSVRAESPYQALLGLLGALALRSQAEEQRALLAAVSDEPPPMVKGPGLADLLGQLVRLLEGIELQAGHGNRLNVRAADTGIGLVLGADWIQAGVRTPLAGLPVRFGIPEPSLERSVPARADPAGLALARLASVREFAGAEFEVEARIDALQVLADAGLASGDRRFDTLVAWLTRPRAVYHLRVTAQQAGRVALVIAETRAGHFHPNSRFARALGGKLSEAGYNVIDLEELSIEVPADPTPDSMATAVAGKTDILVYGVVTAEVESQLPTGLVFARSGAELVVVDVAERKVLAKPHPRARSPGLDVESAFDRCLDALAKKVFASLPSALVRDSAGGP